MAIEDDTDIAELVPSRIGTAVHEQIEYAWADVVRPSALRALGYPETLINSVVINPEPGTDLEGKTPVYLEIRKTKQLGKWKIGGKFDFVAEGTLTDFKTTKTYSFISGSNEDGYMKQGSIYKWLNPDIITNDVMNIGYIFTDWIAMKALQDKNYPQTNIVEKKLPLMKEDAIETFILHVLSKIERYTGAPQKDMPLCTKDELWQRDSVWKYFKDPAKRSRSTKNFDNPGDANQRNASDGSKGIVVEVAGEVKRCNYCNARPICLQADQLKRDGLLK